MVRRKQEVERSRRNRLKAEEELEIDEAEIDEAEMDEAEMDEAEMDEAEMDEAEIDEAEIDEAEIDEAEMDEAELHKYRALYFFVLREKKELLDRFERLHGKIEFESWT